MNEKPVVVVFPAKFSNNKIGVLISNIRLVLKAKKLKINKIRKDESLIIVEADDSVFVSSAIGNLFGIEKIAIAKESDNKFNEVVSLIVKTGRNLLLNEERFLIKVEGTETDYSPKDLELAATSNLIEKTVELKTKPGTELFYDKLIYTYITKSRAYVCIFVDKGSGGLPNGSQRQSCVCGIYDELSSMACLQMLRMGFDMKIIIFYVNESELLHIIKLVNQILSRMVSNTIELFFCKLELKTFENSKLIKLAIISEVLASFAKITKINRVSLALSPVIFPLSHIEQIIFQFNHNKVIPWFPLLGIEDNLNSFAKENGFEKFIPNLEKLKKRKSKGTLPYIRIRTIALRALGNVRSIKFELSSKNIHVILDTLKSEQPRLKGK